MPACASVCLCHGTQTGEAVVKASSGAEAAGHLQAVEEVEPLSIQVSAEECFDAAVAVR